MTPLADVADPSVRAEAAAAAAALQAFRSVLHEEDEDGQPREADLERLSEHLDALESALLLLERTARR